MEIMEAVSVHGAGLKRIDILACLAEPETLTTLFTTVGSTVESLKRDFFADRELLPSNPRFDLMQIVTLCPHVTDILLVSLPDFCRSEAFNLYCLYGAQLKTLSLCGKHFD